MDKKTQDIENLAEAAGDCKKCGLSKSRNNVVFGKGNPSSGILLVGEAPGYNEDMRGVPFCGKAGDVLDILLSSAGMKREDVYITNIIKCRPPQNRDPEPAEIESCREYLEKQIEIIKPRIIGCLGRHSLRYFMDRFSFDASGSISTLHGRVFEHSSDMFNRIKVVALYHPAVAVYDPGKIDILKNDFKIFAEI